MKRRYIFLFLIIFTVLTVFADGNYFYYRSSEGEDAGAFPNIGENPGGPGGGGGFPIPGDWLLFSTSEGIFIGNNCTINAENGPGRVGTNSVESESVVFGNNVSITPNELYIGVGGSPEEVVSGFNGKIIGLASTQTFYNPCLFFENDLPQIPTNLTNRGSIDKNNNVTIEITESGMYEKIKTKNNGTINLKTKEGFDLVLEIENISLGNNNSINVYGKGRLFLFITESFDINNNTSINTYGIDSESVFIIFKGITNDFSVDIDSDKMNFYVIDCDGNLSINSSKMNQLYIKDCEDMIVNIHNNITIDRIFASKTAEIAFHNNCIIQNAFVSCQSEISVHNNIKTNLIFAPSANLTLKNNAKLNGAAIVNKFIAKNNISIEGEPFSFEQIPEVIFPEPIGTYIYYY